MRTRSLIVFTAAIALVALLSVGTPQLTDDRHVWVMRDGDGHREDGSSGWLGVRIESTRGQDQAGVRVTSVIPDSPAAEAGLERGDIIVAVDGRSVGSPGALTERVRELRGGDRITLTVMRDGDEVTLDAELADIGTMVEERVRTSLEGLQLNLEGLAERLEGLEGLQSLEGLEGLEGLAQLEHLGDLDFDINFDFDFDFDNLAQMGRNFEHMGRVFVQRPRLGVGLSETTPELRRHLGGDDDSGALVDRVIEGSPAADAGVRVGDLIVAIDGTPVKSAWDIRRALQASGRVRIDVIRDGAPQSFDITLPDPLPDPDDETDDLDRPRGPRG